MKCWTTLIAQFKKWYSEAEAAEVIEPNTMTLATVGDQNQPTIQNSVDERR